MALALLVLRIVLAAVFLVAGIAKLADRAGSQQALCDFGVPASLARPSGILLPLAELAVAGALLLPTFTSWGAIGALGLFLLFIGVISFNLAHGRTPTCHCFGQLHATPAGWPTLVRNLLLATSAGLLVGFGPGVAALSPFAWLGLLSGAQRLELFLGVFLLGLIVLEGWGLLLTIQQQGRFLLRIEELEAQLVAGSPLPPEGLPIGTPAPTFRLSALFSSKQPGTEITLEELRAPGKPVLLLFSDPGCGPCREMLPAVARWQQDYASQLTLAFISRGDAEANRQKANEHGISRVLLQEDREVAEAYQANGTPSAVLVRPEGTIGSALALGAETIHALISQVVELPLSSEQHAKERYILLGSQRKKGNACSTTAR